MTFYELDTWKVVIGWGKANLDLDAYLRLPKGDYVLQDEELDVTEKRLISYDCKKLFYNSATVTLDLDNRTAYGIETITGKWLNPVLYILLFNVLYLCS